MIKSTIRAARLLLALSAVAALSACVTAKLPPPVASAANVEKLRAASAGPAQLGVFKLAPGKPADMDTTVGGLRGSSVSPSAGTFSLQLREELGAELKAAGLLDPASPVIIEGLLTDSQVDAAIGTGTGRLAARFSVKRDGKVVFDKELAVDAKWDSSFVGAIAIPAAINQYGALYKSLVGKLLDDADFRAAVKR
ncbi:hypothetical protein SAMN05216359_11943 [Roseateles sp. YR242]|uniref:hypothetical protein n=1 Tax=Roseateles sp. YR242 TaxID=1855305 RepID=UPI0008BFB4CA|nr:hypothetical protein [Roseateles sp. YR242]SEL84448.1 hypothetical protein SAMN05216359_11943 [Roseateles sp. YR242]